jgi:uncharacterized ferritin-like protein (DUF455 family)
VVPPAPGLSPAAGGAEPIGPHLEGVPRGELRAVALGILETPCLEAKLAPPPRVRDRDPGPAVRLIAPARPPGLAIVSARGARAARVPPLAGMRDPAQRARILHALCNHELQAVELFAWAILAFPDAPLRFRQGLCAILREEQRHARLYQARLEAHGHRFGDFPVTGHFWNLVPQMDSPVAFLCVMGLTLENANLDFALAYAEAARAAGDRATAEALEEVHRDEIRHVRFAVRWLARLRDDSQLAIYRATVRPPLHLGRARGAALDRPSRIAAGLDAELIDALEAAAPVRPSGGPR